MQYQNIDFGGTVIEGKDRSPDYDQIFPEPPVGKTILDVGCNLGYYSIRAGLEGAKWVVGIDNHEAFIDTARKIKSELPLDDNVRFNCMSFDKVGTPANFDIVLLLNVMHHLPTPAKVENWIQRASKIAKEKIVFEVLHTDKPIEVIHNKKNNPKIHISMDFIRRTLPDWGSFTQIPSRVTDGRNIVIACKNR